jgi:hypothetical protein
VEFDIRVPAFRRGESEEEAAKRRARDDIASRVDAMATRMFRENPLQWSWARRIMRRSLTLARYRGSRQEQDTQQTLWVNDARARIRNLLQRGPAAQWNLNLQDANNCLAVHRGGVKLSPEALLYIMAEIVLMETTGAAHDLLQELLKRWGCPTS